MMYFISGPPRGQWDFADQDLPLLFEIASGRRFYYGPAMPNISPLPDIDSLCDFAKAEKTAEKLDHLIPLAKESGDVEYFLILLTQIARAQGALKEIPEAHQTLDEVQEGLTESTPLAKIRYFLERGRLFLLAKDPTTAGPLLARAHELAVQSSQVVFATEAETLQDFTGSKNL